MKFLHLADLHFGKQVNNVSMLEEQRAMNRQIIALAKEHQADALVIAGDVYDKTAPADMAVALLDEFLTEVVAAGLTVFMVRGNHDSAEKLNFGSKLFASHQVFIAAKYDKEARPFVYQDEYGPVNFYLLPFVSKRLLEQELNEGKPFDTYSEAFQAALQQVPVAGERNVVVAHQFVTAGGKVELAGSESKRVNVGTLDNINCSVFEGFDYVALGHIHNAQGLDRESCRYAGTLLRYDVSETKKADKTVPLVTMGPKGEVKVELLPVKPQHEMVHWEKSFAEVQAEAAKVVDKNIYLHVTLTDKEPIADAAAMLKQDFPHLLHLEYKRSPGSGIAGGLDTPDARNRSFEEIMEGFYTAIMGEEAKLEQEEWELLREVAKEAGVIE